jgi:hypothetical protein
MWKRLVVSLLVFVAMISFTTVKIHNINTLTYADQDLKAIMDSTTASVNDILLQRPDEFTEADDDSADNLSAEADAVALTSAEAPETGSETMPGTDAKAENTVPRSDIKTKDSDLPQMVSKEEEDISARGDVVTMTYNTLCSDYALRMTSLEAASEKALDDLVENAKAEYLMTDAKERQSLEFKGRMAAKYFELAKNLEEMVDHAVDVALDEFKASLETYGYDTQVVDEMASKYEQTKTIRRNEILSEIMSKAQDTL